MRWGQLLLALLSGAMAGLGHAPFGLWFVSLVGFALLIRLVACGSIRGALPHTLVHLRREEAHRGASSPERPVRLAWVGGLGYFGVTLFWIVEPFLVDVARHGWMAPFALVLMAGGLALFWAAAGWISTRLAWPALGFAVALSLGELARGYVLTGFPWALPAYIWADTALIGTSAYIGPFGLSAVTLCLAALPSASQRVWPGAALAAVGYVGLAFVAGEPALKSEALGVVRIVQPNAPQDEKWDPEKAHIFVERAIELTAAEGRDVALTVWPESAIPYPLDTAGPVLERASEAAGASSIVTGINRRTPEGDWYNSAIVIGAGGTVAQSYDKVHLVPFGEYIPLKIGFIRDLAGFSGFGFTKGAGVRLIDTALGRALPLICYEAIFPRHGAGLNNRPDYLLQITNDAWFGTFSGPYQHLDQARFRAVEQGLPLIRAANTGVSAVIGPTGSVLDALELGAAGALDVRVPAGTIEATVYSKIGDRPVGAILLLSILILYGLRRRSMVASDAKSS